MTDCWKLTESNSVNTFSVWTLVIYRLLCKFAISRAIIYNYKPSRSCSRIFFTVSLCASLLIDCFHFFGHIKVCVLRWLKIIINSDSIIISRPYSYSQCWTGTSLQWRLMQGNLFKCKSFLIYPPPPRPPLPSIASQFQSNTEKLLIRSILLLLINN